MRASIDIGSNSCLFLAGEFSDKVFYESANLSNVTGLGRELDKDQVFTKVAMEETLEAIKLYASECDSLGVSRDSVVATATEASRVAKNANEFYDNVLSETGIKVHIINGVGEAYYTSLGASLGLSDFSEEEIVLMDIGGASTEFIRMNLKTRNIKNSISLPLGVVRLTEWKDQRVEEANIARALKHFDSSLFKTNRLVGIAGSVTSQMAMNLNLSEYRDELIHKQELTFEEYVDFSNKLYALPTDQIKLQFPYLSKRAAYLHAGADLILMFLKELEAKRLLVSTFGVRHGTLFEGLVQKKFLAN